MRNEEEISTDFVEKIFGGLAFAGLVAIFIRNIFF
jgi:DNA-binding IscR family transcriptional regulator